MLGCGATSLAVRLAFKRNKLAVQLADVGAVIGVLASGGFWLADSIHDAQPMSIGAVRCRVLGAVAGAFLVGACIDGPPPAPRIDCYDGDDGDDESGRD
jgi:hypothetical protein